MDVVLQVYLDWRVIHWMGCTNTYAGLFQKANPKKSSDRALRKESKRCVQHHPKSKAWSFKGGMRYVVTLFDLKSLEVA